MERILPDASMQIVINLAGDRIPVYDPGSGALRGTVRGAIVCGPRSAPAVIDTATQCSMLGVHFHPGGMRPFVRAPLDELRDAQIGLDCVWGRFAEQLRERVLAAPDAAGQVRVVEQCLCEHTVRPLEPNAAVAFAARRCSEGAPLAAIANEIGIARNRFTALFSDRIGMTPKRFARVQRFQRAVHRIAGERDPVDWAGLALECGYFDQAHFIHEFRQFSGLTPGAYARVRTEHLNHVPLLC